MTETLTPVRHSPADIARALGQHVPTEEQQAVIEAPLAPQLVVAGAGSGKTETMSARVVYLVANGQVRADEVLGLTFTRKAAAELSDRVRLRLRQLRRAGLLAVEDARMDVDRPTIATYNSFAADIAKEHALRIGMDPDARLVTEAGAWQLADGVVQGWHAALDVDATPGSVTEAVLSLSGALAEHLLSTDDAREQLEQLTGSLTDATPAGRAKEPYADTRKAVVSLRERLALLDLVDAYARAKREHGVMDFADQVAMAARIAQAVPAVGQALREQYPLVLLDEYQDTSVAQLQLLSSVFGDGHAVTAVGDPNQAIYGWRGAAAAALADFPAQFPSLGRAGQEHTPTRYLRTSWRNDARILAVANRVSGPLRLPEDGAPAPVEVPELVARPGAGEGRVLGGYAESTSEEVAGIADFFVERWAPEQTAAVLCRTRSQFTGVVEALRARGVPVEVLGLGGLLAAPEVVDVRAALEAAHDASRGDSAMRLLTGAGLGAADLHVLGAWARSLAAATGAKGEASVVEAVDQPPAAGWHAPSGAVLTADGLRRVRRLGDLLRQVRSLSYLSLPEVVAHTITLMGLDIEVAARAGRVPAHARGNLDAFVDVAASFAADTGAGLGTFLGWLDAAEERERGLEPVDADPEPGAVQVLTVHAAKGLEWDVVAVPGMVESQFPSYKGRPSADGAVSSAGWLTDRTSLPYPLRGDAESLPALDIPPAPTHADVRDALAQLRRDGGRHAVGEERRLAYVAVTRARHTLLLTGSWFRTGKTPLPPSRFLTEPRDAGLVEEAPPGWTAQPAEDAVNPSLERVVAATWPLDPLGERRGRLEAAAVAVRTATGLPPEPAGDVARWARDAALLLREREEARAAGLEVSLGTHLSASGVVGLAEDPHAFALERRRPMPSAPSEHASVGNLFHAWVEEYYGAPSLLDVEGADALFGTEEPAERPAGAAPDLEELKRTFTTSAWATRRPVAVEVDLETAVAGTVVRCRIDAVFDDEQGLQVVDWKTGAPPRDAHTLASRELQLALYRLAWSRHTGRPVEEIGAAFYYVGADRTLEAGRLPEEEIERRLGAALAALTGDRSTGVRADAR
ncbi:DNA helicase-2 / ATP-dependent DNA helicase PcrA [Georgenia satyanarayanai]|uniref:DNA 3'-5' helicase n=1 Tax=Georgenia satyanarayanai TaxID=860221 RepID=A0A2Y9A688_9MICO|nr:ATP-dependent DNA helicase [Georgenia satyanarayanai]PYG00552.1 DNA helicase-2/ATP-dependent DNA helicase PcrA [Georgenia satyanarayanai]SSA39941.1 DNA helicase-2 / ATP-dependent DNA helicase PcrA [Georgenia satyanarayanai]